MGLFSRRSRSLKDPHEWSGLWSYVGPYGGRVTPAGAQLCAQYARRLSLEELKVVARELELARGLVWTQRQAEHIGGYPWRGKDEMFSCARFMRAVDAVVVAGPDAVVRVRDEPALIAEFDSGLEVAPYEEADPPGTLGMRLYEQMEAAGMEYDVNYVGLKSDTPHWPKLRMEYASLPLDPERDWVYVDVLDDDDESDAWDAACEITRRRFFDAFGGPVKRSLSIGTVSITGCNEPIDDWKSGSVSLTKLKVAGVSGYVRSGITGLGVEFLMSPEELAVRDVNEQVRILTWKGAASLLPEPAIRELGVGAELAAFVEENRR